MKPFSKISVLLFLLLFSYSCAVQQQHSAYTQQEQSVNFQVFYDELSPYGQWVDYPNYGYVWLPQVRRNFSPYSTDGYWVNTQYGWTWVSDYNWGWAPFHYGRWDYDSFYGWFWVPDNEWGPSWVNWRSGNGYYGWEPMRPGMNNNQGYNDGFRDINRWNFVRDRDFGREDIHRYYIDRREYNTIIINTTVINNTTFDRRRNTTYVAGPRRENVQRVTGRSINSVAIRDTDRPGQKVNNKQLNIYRPRIERTTVAGQRPAPSRVTNREEVKSARERNATNPRNNVTPPENDTRNKQRQPGEQIHRRRQEIQSQPIDRQQTQPVQQPQVTPQQQQNERRRQGSQQGVQQQQIERQNQQIEKVQPIQPKTQQRQVSPPQKSQQSDRQKQQQRRRQERQDVKQTQQIERQSRQNQKTQPEQRQTQQPQVTPTQPTQQVEKQKQPRRRQAQQP